MDRSALSNAILSAARSHYRRGRPLPALVYLGRAIFTPPDHRWAPLEACRKLPLSQISDGDKRTMRIVHISVGDDGGGGERSAFRIHRGLRY